MICVHVPGQELYVHLPNLILYYPSFAVFSVMLFLFIIITEDIFFLIIIVHVLYFLVLLEVAASTLRLEW